MALKELKQSVSFKKNTLLLKGLKQSLFHLRKNIGTEGVKTIYVSFKKKILVLKGLKPSMFHLRKQYWY